MRSVPIVVDEGRGEKRGLEDSEFMESDDVIAGIAHSDGKVIYLDDITKEELDPDQVQAGMEKEWQSFQKFEVLKPATADELVGHKMVGLRWVLRKRKDSVKARLVAQEVNLGDWSDAFAATPTLIGQRLLIWTFLNNADYVVGSLDISTAFLHASLPDGHVVALKKPKFGVASDEKCDGFFAQKAVYGLRVAPRAFSGMLC